MEVPAQEVNSNFLYFFYFLQDNAPSYIAMLNTVPTAKTNSKDTKLMKLALDSPIINSNENKIYVKIGNNKRPIV